MKRFCLILAIIFGVAGIGLFIWLGVGQYVAQLNFDGQYIEWRAIKDVSLWGYTGFGAFIIAAAFVFAFEFLDHNGR